MVSPVEALYRLKTWLEGLADKPTALFALFVIAFIESSIFPIPPDVLLIALGVSKSRRSFVYSSVAIAGSFAGSFLGYAIGHTFFDAIGGHLVDLFGMRAQFEAILQKYHDNAWPVLLLAGFTNIPFCLFTIAAGFGNTVPIGTFAFATLVGRAVRFSLVGGLLFAFGPAVKVFLDKYLLWVSISLGLLFVVVMLLAGRVL